ncbi:hypothetical protein ACFWPK_05980 [Nocardia sp. NPDC058519]|uniref:hypothetical protein n=1 Tax=Nocardia sp. NPDC058519 TaxID=3346535 RepID=UPI003660F22C
MTLVEKRRLGPIFLAVAVVVAGIAMYVSDRKPPRIRADPVATHVWSSAPGIDLGSRAAELVRATVESTVISRKAGLDFTYPGFREARRDASFDWGFAASDGMGSDYEYWLESDRSTYVDHVATIGINDRWLNAKVCQYQVPEPGENWTAGEFAGNFRIYVVKFENLNPSQDVAGSGIPKSGRRTPDWNVFGDWRITDIAAATREWEPHDCRNWFATQAPGLEFGADLTAARSTEDTVIPYGPIRPQFPRWRRPD